MSFSLSISGHVAGVIEAEAKEIEKDLVAAVKELLGKSRFAPHVTSGQFSGSHVQADLKPPAPPAAVAAVPAPAPAVPPTTEAVPSDSPAPAAVATVPDVAGGDVVQPASTLPSPV